VDSKNWIQNVKSLPSKGKAFLSSIGLALVTLIKAQGNAMKIDDSA
jgi:hypothetical protein